MIDHLDNLLRHLFLSHVTGITDAAQVRFQPPDEEWRAYVSNLTVDGQPANALNVYLVDLRENRKLRSNERAREAQNGIVNETPAPLRVDCHYLITAWSPSTVTQAVEPTVDEHALLYNVTAVLMNHESLVPSQVYAPDPLPATFPPLIADAELPIVILPVEGFPKYGEFWGTMGAKHPWKPAVYVVVTLPVALPTEVAGPMVTTRIVEFRQSGHPETAEVLIQIGGTVLDDRSNPPVPIPRAWVRLETTVNGPLHTTETNELGRFTFNSLRPGPYRLLARATGLGEKARDVDVPSPSGEYDVRFP